MTADGNSLPFSATRQVEQICSQFEESFKAGKHPRIEEIVSNSAVPDREILLRALLDVELALLGRAGKKLRQAEYRARFPNDTQVVEQAFKDFAKRSGAVKDSSKSLPEL
ncbi:MAG TPA: hypothetical protein DIW81_16560, partial [Planctomycetaceae bacterium]|nr:hypothetical protein [Planctomycetaceae bacterium]